jgi:hypothetical protein
MKLICKWREYGIVKINSGYLPILLVTPLMPESSFSIVLLINPPPLESGKGSEDAPC